MADAQPHRSVVEETPEVVHQRLLVDLTPILSRQSRFELVSENERSLVYTRRFTPTWAKVLGILGLFFLLLGALFFLVRRTQTVVISLSPHAGGGTEIVITGVETATIPSYIQDELFAPAIERTG